MQIDFGLNRAEFISKLNWASWQESPRKNELIECKVSERGAKKVELQMQKWRFAGASTTESHQRMVGPVIVLLFWCIDLAAS